MEDQDRQSATMELEACRAELASVRAQLATREEELARAQTELDAFAYSISHDLRAPLRAIDGFSTALGETLGPEASPDARMLLGRVQGAAGRMRQLIDDLLALSRSTREPLRMERVDVAQLGLAVVEDLRRQHPERTVEFVGPECAEVPGDVRALRIVLDNLLGNAWKFTGKRDQARITLDVERQEGRVRVTVKDNGAGFDPTYAGRLFTPFQRLHSQHEFVGSGIGLAIVQRIVHRLHGTVGAEGVPDQGATVWFELPTTSACP